MPYSDNLSLPISIKVLPVKGQTIWRKAFNAALRQYKDEGTARKVAWAAVKKKYEKNTEGNWILKKTIESFVSLQCSLVALTKEEILSAIPKKTLDSIKKKDAHPFFQAYVVCHEGTSTPTIVDGENRPIHWSRAAVQSLRSIINKGIKFFHGHNKDSSHTGRKVIGKSVGSLQKVINGKLSHVLIAYHKKEHKDEVKKYDVCSQEAVWDLIEAGKIWLADKIKSLTGIALDNSKRETPAFSGAKRLGMVQAFENKTEGDVGEMSENKTIKFEDVKKWVKEHNVFPNQLYTIDDLKNDRDFGPVIKEGEEIKGKLEEVEKNNKDLTKKLYLTSVKDRLTKVMQDKKLTDKQSEYVNKYFNENMEDLSDEALNTYVEKQVEDFKERASFFTSTETGETRQADVANDDYTKAECNELLEEDID